MALLFLLSSLLVTSLSQASLDCSLPGEICWHDIYAIKGSDISLLCPADLQSGNITWWGYDNDNQEGRIEIATCMGLDCNVSPSIQDETYIVRRNATCSSLTTTVKSVTWFTCIDENRTVIERFNVSLVPPPSCRISPSILAKGGFDVKLHCEWDASSGATGYFEMDGNEEKTTKLSGVQGISRIIKANKLLTSRFPPCTLTLPYISERPSCTFPLYINMTVDFDNDDAIFECNFTTDLESPTFKWKVLDRQRSLVDVSSRSWTQDDGRRFLLQKVGNEDYDTVVECAVSSGRSSPIIDAIGFSIIKENILEEDAGTGSSTLWTVHNLIEGAFGLLQFVIIGLICAILARLSKMKSTLWDMFFIINSMRQENKVSTQSSSPGNRAHDGNNEDEKTKMHYSVPRHISIANDEADVRSDVGATRASSKYNDGYVYMGGDPDDLDYEDLECEE